jgi:hypothetical protein
MKMRHLKLDFHGAWYLGKEDIEPSPLFRFELAVRSWVKKAGAFVYCIHVVNDYHSRYE